MARTNPPTAAKRRTPAKKTASAEATPTPSAPRRRPGRPQGTTKEGSLTSTQRVQNFRARRKGAGGAELSLFLPPHAAIALRIIRAVHGLEFKVAAVERSLIAEAQRLVPNEQRLQALVGAKKLDGVLGKKWLRALDRMTKSPARRSKAATQA